MHTKTPGKPHFHFGLMIAGMIFLCNPNINLLDILPDFIGYLLLAFSLAETAEVFPHFEEARSGFIRLAWISLSKVPAAVLMMFIWGSDKSQSSIITVFSLSYAVVMLMFSLPTFSHFFEGIFYMGQRHDCPAALGVPASFGKLDAEGFRKLTLGFFVLKEVMSTLPEFALISVKQYDPDPTFTGNVFISSAYYPLFVLIGALIVLICGIIWICMMISYLRFLQKDGTPERLLCGCFEERADYFARKRRAVRVNTAVMLIVTAVGFSIDLIFDDMNVLPDAICAILLILAMCLLTGESRRAKPAMALCGVYGAAALWAYVVRCVFINRFEYRDIPLVEEAKSLYGHYTVASAVSLVTFLLALGAVCLVLSDIQQQFEKKNGEKIALHELPAQRKRRLLAFGLLGGVSEIASFFSVIVNSHTHSVAVEGQGTFLSLPNWEWYWMIPLVLSLSWLIYSCLVADGLRERVAATAND